MLSMRLGMGLCMGLSMWLSMGLSMWLCMGLGILLCTGLEAGHRVGHQALDWARRLACGLGWGRA